jgi:hypothetical protein
MVFVSLSNVNFKSSSPSITCVLSLAIFMVESLCWVFSFDQVNGQSQLHV